MNGEILNSASLTLVFGQQVDAGKQLWVEKVRRKDLSYKEKEENKNKQKQK